MITLPGLTRDMDNNGPTGKKLIKPGNAKL